LVERQELCHGFDTGPPRVSTTEPITKWHETNIRSHHTLQVKLNALFFLEYSRLLLISLFVLWIACVVRRLNDPRTRYGGMPRPFASTALHWGFSCSLAPSEGQFSLLYTPILNSNTVWFKAKLPTQECHRANTKTVFYMYVQSETKAVSLPPWLTVH
jgi:hypothetical protein